MEPNPPGEVKLARTLGLGSIVLLGVGALLGGGIFTLLGPAAGLAGPGLFLAMLLGAGVAFLNLQMYIALGTTFPEAGGGYLWVKKGLGNFQGFQAGWMSWFAHSAAAGLYALSFGYYGFELLKIITGNDFGWSATSAAKIMGMTVVVLFGYLNWRGAKSTRGAGNIIDSLLVCLLLLFIIFGAIKIFSEPTQSFSHFTPLLPNGILGVVMAASFFYIAFEGSEIQVQAGEETKDTKRTLRVGLIASWAIVSVLYLLVSLVIIGATRDGGASWQALSGWGEGAIAKAAQTFMPFGNFLMIVGGIFANLGALNATIYSSSRVSFALARDKNIWSRLADIHLKNLSPHIAVIVTTILVILMMAFLPLFDVAAIASLMFILLFLQLNLAGIRIHYKWPDTQWNYKVPFFPILPIAVVIIYILLAFTMLQVNLSAWVVALFWLLLGFVNYFAYAETKSREQFETGIVYEESVRIGPKTGKRILLPIASNLNEAEVKSLAENAFVLTSKYDGELVIINVHEIPASLPLDQSMVDPVKFERERELSAKLQEWVAEYNRKTGPEVKDINFHSLILIGRDIVDVILDVVKMEDCDLLMLHWRGYAEGQNVILSRKIDRILRESKCDLLVVKNPRPAHYAIISTNPKGGSPYGPHIGEIAMALKDYYHTKLELLSIIEREIPAYLKPDPTPMLKTFEMKRKDFADVTFKTSRSIVHGILEEVRNKNADLLIIGAAQPKLLSEIRVGNLAETLLKKAECSVMVVRGHQGAAGAFWWNLIRKFSARGNSV